MRKTSKSYRNIKTFGSISAESLSITDQFTLPLEDGEAGQVLVTDGAGTVSWLGLGSLSLDTDGVPEGSTNLYYTPERVDDRVAALIKNGLGLNWTYNDVANTLTGNVTLAPFSTSNLSEGSNLYYTGERVDDRVATSLIKNGTGISWVYVDNGTGAGTLTPTVSLSPFSTTNLSEGVNLYFTNERAQDAAAALIKNGVGISWLYNDIANTLTPTVTLSPFNTDNLAEGSTNLYFTGERVDDRVAALVQDTATVTWSYSDNGLGAGVLEATAVASMSVQEGGTLIGTRNIINFIEGPGVTLNISDDSINSRIDVIISSTGGGSGIGTVSIVASGGVQVGDADIEVLNFLNKFSITESPNKQVNIDIDMLIDELSDVILTSPISDGDALVYDSGTGMWTNSQVVGVQGSQGFQGDQGDQGDQGYQGPQGYQGSKGDQGFQGTQGDRGFQGTQGDQGFQGDQGSQGATGAPGTGGVVAQWGSFYDTTDQPISSVNTAQVVDIGSSFGANGISIQNGSEITLPVVGTYKFTAVLQVSSISNSTHYATYWLRLNGVDYANSGTNVLLQPRKSATEPYTDLITIDYIGTTQNTNDYIEIWWDSDSTDVSLQYTAATGSEPAIPSIICGIHQITGTIEGEQGFQGDQGYQGDQGFQGTQGDTGAQGNQGDTGAQGDQGAIGAQGDQGEAGAQGNQGDTGAQGDQGAIGAQGDQGEAGAQGDQGIQGAQGFQGRTGADGAQGDQGDQGYQGPQGFQGLGNQGFQGYQGPSGSGGGGSPTLLVNAMHYFKDGMYDYSSDSRVHVHGLATEGWWATFSVSTTSGIKLTPGVAPTSLLANTYHSSLITVPSNISSGSTIYLTYTVFSPLTSDLRDQLVWYLGKVPSSQLTNNSYVVTPLMPIGSGYVIFGSTLTANTSLTHAHGQETITFTTSSAITAGTDSLVIGFASRLGGDLTQSPVHLSYKLWY